MPRDDENPLPPLTILERLEAERLTEDNGFGLPQGEVDGWLTFAGLACRNRLWIARGDGHWLIGLAHRGAMAEVAADTPAAPVARPDSGPAVTVDALGPIIRRLFRLARSLPTAPLDSFVAETHTLPKTTEAERLVVQRVGQDIFRSALLDYWGGACPLTGITETALLRASHIVPWKDCPSDAERLDVHNGLLLSALWDAAFDQGLVTFDDEGRPQFSPTLSDVARAELRWQAALPLASRQKQNLAWHRAHVFLKSVPAPASPFVNQNTSNSADR